jgi:ferric-dicitrate binding protein FerR (iron transport regulator)
MAITGQLAKSAGPYVDQLFDDDYVREQLGDALVRGRRAYRRARREKAAEAVQDKKLLEHVTGAARSLQAAARALTGRPQPKPRRRRARTAALLGAALIVGGLAAYVDSRERAKDEATTAPSDPSGAVRARAAG